jgi:hypothetical protein
MKIYKRNCPKCNKELETKNKHYYNKAVIENKLCLSCSLTGREFSEEHKSNLSKNHADVGGKNNPFYNKKHSDEVRSKISEAVTEKYKNPELRKRVSEIRKEWHVHNENSFKGKTHSESTKEVMSFLATQRFEDEDERIKMSNVIIEWHKYNETPFKGKSHTVANRKLMRDIKINHYKENSHPWEGRNHSIESKIKMRESAIKRVIRQGTVVGYNPNSIPILEEFARENGYTIQHAENGGEFQVPNTTFFVDAYDSENNVVIEYDEKYHLKEEQVEKDKKRQQIIGNILKCKFIRLMEDGEIRIFDYSKNN